MTDERAHTSTPKRSRGPLPVRHPRFLAEDRLLAPDSPYSASERFVGLALLHYLNRAGCAWPSKETLAATGRISPRTVQRALRGLCCGPHALFRRDLRRRGTPLYSIQGETNCLPKGSPRGDKSDLQGETNPTSKGRQIVSHNTNGEHNGEQRENAAASVNAGWKELDGRPPPGRPFSTPGENANGAGKATPEADPKLRRLRERQSEILAKVCLISQRTAAVEMREASQTPGGRSYRDPLGCPSPAWGRATMDRLEARLEDLEPAQRPVVDDRYTPQEAERVKREILAKRPGPSSAPRPSGAQALFVRGGLRGADPPEPPKAEPVRWAERVRGRMNGVVRAPRPTRLSNDLRALKRQETASQPDPARPRGGLANRKDGKMGEDSTRPVVHTEGIKKWHEPSKTWVDALESGGPAPRHRAARGARLPAGRRVRPPASLLAVAGA